MVHHWGKYELSTGRGSAALQEAKVPLEEKAEQLKQGAGVGQWDQGPGCVCFQAQQPCPLVGVHTVVWKKPACPSCTGGEAEQDISVLGQAGMVAAAAPE